MALMLKNARLIDPQIGLDEVADILIPVSYTHLDVYKRQE